MEFDIVCINLLIQFLSFVQEIFLMKIIMIVVVFVHLVYLMLIQEEVVAVLIEFDEHLMMM
jgi:hypothetical protein